jgi:hypothetical protein
MVGVTTLGFARFSDVNVAPDETSQLTADLLDHGVSRVYAQYWIAYTLTWQSDERIIASPDVSDRYPAYSSDVRSARRAAYVFWLPFDADNVRYATVLKGFKGLDLAYSEFDSGRYRVVIPDRNVPPEALPS